MPELLLKPSTFSQFEEQTWLQAAGDWTTQWPTIIQELGPYL